MALVVPYQGISPKIHPSAFLAPNATVIGDLEVGEDSGIWFGAVLRGDVMPLRVGKRTSIQDNTVIHATGGWSATTVGDDVTVGHAVILHGCTIHDRVLARGFYEEIYRRPVNQATVEVACALEGVAAAYELARRIGDPERTGAYATAARRASAWLRDAQCLHGCSPREHGGFGDSRLDRRARRQNLRHRRVQQFGR